MIMLRVSSAPGTKIEPCPSCIFMFFCILDPPKKSCPLFLIFFARFQCSAAPNLEPGNRPMFHRKPAKLVNGTEPVKTGTGTGPWPPLAARRCPSPPVAARRRPWPPVAARGRPWPPLAGFLCLFWAALGGLNWKRMFEKTRVGFGRTELSLRLSCTEFCALSSGHGPRGRGFKGFSKTLNFHDFGGSKIGKNMKNQDKYRQSWVSRALDPRKMIS